MRLGDVRSLVRRRSYRSAPPGIKCMLTLLTVQFPLETEYPAYAIFVDPVWAPFRIRKIV